MSAEPIDTRAVLQQWLQRLVQHPNRPAVDPGSLFGTDPLKVHMLDFPTPYFQTTCTLQEAEESDEVQPEDAEAEEAQGEEGEEQEYPPADAIKTPGVEAGFELADGAAGITVVGDNVYLDHAYIGPVANEYCSSDIDTTPSSRPRNTSAYIRVDVRCDAVHAGLPPALLYMYRNGDVELVYQILTRSQVKSYVTIHGAGIDVVLNMFLHMHTTDLRNRWVLKVLSAAVKVHGIVYAVPVPQRHNHAIKAAALAGHASPKNPVTQRMQGFMLSDGSFADRKTSLAAAVLSGQLPYDPERTELFSEDLW